MAGAAAGSQATGGLKPAALTPKKSGLFCEGVGRIRPTPFAFSKCVPESGKLCTNPRQWRGLVNRSLAPLGNARTIVVDCWRAKAQDVSDSLAFSESGRGAKAFTPWSCRRLFQAAPIATRRPESRSLHALDV